MNNELEEKFSSIKDKINKKDSEMGPKERALENSLEKLGMKTEVYFGGDAMVGNISKKAYKSFNNGEEILLDCLNEDEHLRQPYLEAFKLISKIHKMLFNEFPTKQETENCAKPCEDFLENSPGWFPDQDITRKCYDLGMILPFFIRREGAKIFKFLSAEEQGKSLHKLFNDFERQYASIPYKPKRYLAMKKAYINRINLK